MFYILHKARITTQLNIDAFRKTLLARTIHKNFADKASKVISQSAAGAEKSEKVAVSPQEAPVLATPEIGKVGAGLELGIVPSSNADMQIGKGFLGGFRNLTQRG